MCGTRPHHSWMTTTPGPLPDAGMARYPCPVVPLLGNSIISPMGENPRGLPCGPQQLRRHRTGRPGKRVGGGFQTCRADDHVDQIAGHELVAPVPWLVLALVKAGGERVPHTRRQDPAD